MTTWNSYYSDHPPEYDAAPGRRRFWASIVDLTHPRSVLEVGCGAGINLEHLAVLGVPVIIGRDAYQPAIAACRSRLPDADLGVAHATEGGPAADLVVSACVLQHIADDRTCERALEAMIRSARRHVLVIEYEAPVRTPVLWRGDPEGIVKRPWGDLLAHALDGKGEIIRSGVLTPDDGWQNAAWHLGRIGPARV
jgi:SAM-dependent methyltransferase